jgi:hypothetical protein
VDVLITREARLEIEALGIIRPKTPGWGFLIGHKRGSRFFVEKILAAGNAGPGTAARRSREIERLWPGKVIGLFAIRPGAELKRALMGPFFYGKLFVELRFAGNRPGARPFIVEFERKFRLTPIPLEPGAGGKDR